MSQIKIEKGVPMVKLERSGKWKDLLNQMSEGDSVLLESPAQVTAFSKAAKILGVQVTTRKTEQGVRGWMLGRGESSTVDDASQDVSEPDFSSLKA